MVCGNIAATHIRPVRMSFDWKSYLIPAITALLVWNLWLQVTTLRDDLAHAHGIISRLETSAKEMRLTLNRQNEAVETLQSAAQVRDISAATRVEQVRTALPLAIRQDRAAGTTPQEVNQWLTLLFSSP